MATGKYRYLIVRGVAKKRHIIFNLSQIFHLVPDDVGGGIGQ
jgi:hypothetical protein